MTKVVSISEFKTKCLKLIDEMQRDGEPLTITRRGKVVAEVTPARDVEKKPFFGMLKGTVTIHGDIVAPVLEDDWEEQWLASWDELHGRKGA